MIVSSILFSLISPQTSRYPVSMCLRVVSPFPSSGLYGFSIEVVYTVGVFSLQLTRAPVRDVSL